MISFERRMDSVEFRIHSEAHIVVDDTICRDCSVRGCITACPADLFVPTSDSPQLTSAALAMEA